MFREAVGGSGEGPGAGATADRPGALSRRLLTWADPLPGLIRRHRLFSIALGLAVLPRAITMLGYQPAVLFKLDTFDYLWGATHLAPDPVNPSGYSLFLRLLLPFHSLALVAGLQHLMGLGLGVMVYAVLRRWRVREWVAVLAALPVLFGAAELLLEQLIMADFLALMLMMAGLAVLLLRGQPSPWRSATAGLLMGASVIVRPTTLPVIALMALYLLVRRAGWRQVCAVLGAGALPVLGYMAWFASATGAFNLTNSNGLFLWSRTMSFANCAVIKPPADLRALCPTGQPRFLDQADPAKRPEPKFYLWDHSSWLWQGKPQTVGLVPDTAAFTTASNARAERFAVMAITAQPLAYARVVASEVIQPFVTNAVFDFPIRQPHSSSLTPPDNLTYALAAVRDYQGSTEGIGKDLSHHLGTRLVEPYAGMIRMYQRLISVPGAIFGLLLAAGFVGVLLPGRRNWPAALLWVSAVVAVVFPVAEHEYTYRYVIPAIPLVCMTVALCFGVPQRKPAVSAGILSASLPDGEHTGAGAADGEPRVAGIAPAEDASRADPVS